MPAPKFQFFEIVRVTGDAPDLAEVRGEYGAIVGRADHEDGTYSYGVFIYREERCWQIEENALEATGQHTDRAALYDGTSIRVRVDKDGRGHLVEEGGSPPG